MQTLRSALFAGGIAVFVLACLAGGYQLFVIEGSPRLSLEYNWWFDALEARGERERAIEQAERALEIDHGFEAISLARLGDKLRDAGRLDEGISAYRRSLMLDPQAAKVHNHLAIALTEQGELAEAIAHLREATRLDPELEAARANLEKLLAHRDQTLTAERKRVDDLRSMLRLAPSDAELRNDLAWLLATSAHAEIRDPAEALRLATAAVEATARRDGAMLDTLATAHAAAGDFARAAAIASEAVAAAETAGDAELARQLVARRAAIRAGVLPR